VLRRNYYEEVFPVLFSMCSIIAILFDSVYAEELTLGSGSCGTNLTWTLSSAGELHIFGDGNMQNYSILGSPWYDFRDKITTVVIENGVTLLGGSAFSGCSNLMSVVIPSSVTSIGESAFEMCSNLTSIVIPEGITSIGGFYGCSSLTSIVIPSSVTSIRRSAFFLCSNLTSIMIPSSVTSIGTSAFSYCRNLTSVAIPVGVISIGDYTFSGCSSLSSVVIPSSVTSIGDYAFSGCSKLTNVEMPEGVTEIGNNTFEYCFGLTSVVIPSSVTSIGGDAFSNCNNLTSIVIPEGVTSIGDYSFYRCSKLTSVVISSSVTSLGEQAFANCSKIESFTVHENNPNYHSDNWGILFSKDLSTLINYPSSRILPYYNIPDETTTILAGAFNACTNLINLYIPPTVTTLQDTSIKNCPGVTICVSLNSPADTFAGTNSLTVWYMDNYTLQGIDIYSLPKQTTYPLGQEDFSGLYLIADYGSKQLQLDDYQLKYNRNTLGLQTVTIEHTGGLATFEIFLYDEDAEHVLDFGAIDAPTGSLTLVSIYDENGKMICIDTAIFTNSEGKAVISIGDYQKMYKAKLFVLNSINMAPQRPEYTIQK